MANGDEGRSGLGTQHGFNWAMLGAFSVIGIAIVTGAISLGSVQTHVGINTERLTVLEAADKAQITVIEKLAAQDAQQERRIIAIEAHDTRTVENEKIVGERLSKIEAALIEINRRLAAHEVGDQKFDDRIAQDKREVATKADITQALNTTRVEFLSEIKRLDEKIEELRRTQGK